MSMTTNNHNSSTDDSETIVAESDPIQTYETLKQITGRLSEVISEAIITPVAKKHFEQDRGHKLRQVLPDKSEEYHFEKYDFEALILPDERRVVNQSYKGNVVSTNGFIRSIDEFAGVITDARTLWEDTFGEWRKHVNQAGHPGPFPLANTDIESGITDIVELYNDLAGSNSIELIINAAENDHYALLSAMFNTDESEMLTPGGDDLSELVRMNSYTTPYNDGSLAVVAPETTNSGSNSAQRGVIVGQDDTPVGVFAHVTDVTNLDRRTTITHDDVRSAMGFDREIDPWSDINELNIETGERIRLQGDLRVERVGDVDGFADEMARTARENEYTGLVESALDDVTIPGRYVQRGRFGRRSDLDIIQAFDITASQDGVVALDPQVTDQEVELLAYATILRDLDTGPAVKYEEYSDISYVIDPWQTRNSMAKNDTTEAINKARDEVKETIEAIVSPHRTEIEARAREIGSEAKAEMDVPTQENLPVDNHLAMIESGFAPDVDTEPVPVGIPKRTTLHIEHGEHNTVNLKINSGVYRFSLLPRGLQPADSRPEW